MPPLKLLDSIPPDGDDAPKVVEHIKSEARTGLGSTTSTIAPSGEPMTHASENFFGGESGLVVLDPLHTRTAGISRANYELLFSF
jgi:hypothetical protein